MPDLGPTYPENGRKVEAPELVPIETILAQATEAATDSEKTEEELGARVAALSAKADRLRAEPSAQ
ncbi:MAG: hypothetical protein ABJ349_20560 [Hyphomicrobiales bacterium]